MSEKSRYFDYYGVPACIWEDGSAPICYCGFYDVEAGQFAPGGDIKKILLDGFEIKIPHYLVFLAEYKKKFLKGTGFDAPFAILKKDVEGHVREAQERKSELSKIAQDTSKIEGKKRPSLAEFWERDKKILSMIKEAAGPGKHSLEDIRKKVGFYDGRWKAIWKEHGLTVFTVLDFRDRWNRFCFRCGIRRTKERGRVYYFIETEINQVR